jgi:hypothetical protein
VVVALAEEADALQEQDRRRVAQYTSAAQDYLDACRQSEIARLPLRRAHERLCELAGSLLPARLPRRS